MKTFAAIAIGSVETEMRIYELSPKKGMKEIDRLASRLNLGADAYRDNKLDVDQVEELCRILNEFRVTMLGYKVDAYQCVATSALRELRSSMITKDHIEKQTGLKIRITSRSRPSRNPSGRLSRMERPSLISAATVCRFPCSITTSW